MTGKSALVTGGGRGIGKQIALRLAADGAAVVVNFRTDAAAAAAVVAQIEDQGGRAALVQADVSDPSRIAELFDAAAAIAPLDIVCSNAGIEHFGALEDITPEVFDRVFHTNTLGQLLVAQQAAQALGPGGAIVLTSSTSASTPVFQHTLYGASKAAVEAIVAHLAVELGQRGIRINAIAPGGTGTDMAAAVAEQYVHPAYRDHLTLDQFVSGFTALQRLAEPAEIAAAVAFLVSDDASYVNGRTLHVDGGQL
ncbi:SDR family oxidoreductase [Mycobacterium avium subsp. hominissuis]|nr:SDR family oxidoreductase [Mycobacterium avium subsp. hominissuis]PBA13812.1 dehydrogenase [Mycobacterium avium]PBA89854.1 dehydrogenase [Mycobacterium avium]PBJ47280.1 dehydrogenase [Mycobacterium avium subsp. hominissuis]